MSHKPNRAFLRKELSDVGSSSHRHHWAGTYLSPSLEPLEERYVLTALSFFASSDFTDSIQAPSDAGSAEVRVVANVDNPDLIQLANSVAPAAFAGLDRIAGDLLTLYSRFTQGGSSSVKEQAINGTPYTEFFVTQDTDPHVQAFVQDVTAALPYLESVGLKTSAVTDTEDWQVVAGFLPVDSVLDASQTPGLIHIEPTQQPELNSDLSDAYSSFSTSNASGSGTNEWDELSGAAQLRRVLPSITGLGIDIGVISDSINQVGGGISDSQNSGDLPTSFVSVLQDLSGRSDEGRAMAELVYDLGPDFDFYFHTGSQSPADMAGGIGELADLNRSEVIVDDISWFNEPYFQDGQISQAVDSAYLNDDVLYFSSAGNRNNEAYYDVWEDDDSDDYHEFSGSDEAFRVSLSNGEQLRLFLQWDEPWGNSTTAYDIEIWNSDLSTKLADSNDSNLGGNPYDALTFTNTTGSTTQFNIIIRYVAGGSPTGQLLHLLAPSNDDDFVDSYANNDRGVVGHHGAQWGFGIGAVPYNNPNTIESFSSRGPATIAFTDGGTRLTTPTNREQPLFTAADGTETTVPGFANFFGTSAAAPNAAAVAGLMLEAAGGGGSLTWTQTRNIMRDTAVGSGTGSWDAVHGYGRINALGAGLVAKGISTSEFTIELNPFGDASFDQNLSSNTDRDRFEFATDISGTTTIEVTESNSLDPAFILWNQESNTFTEIDYNDGGDIDDAAITRTISSWTLHQAEVFSESNLSSSANFTIHVNAPDQLIANLGTGASLTSSGSISSEDADYFQFTAPPEATGLLSLSLSSATSLDGVLTLYDSAGNQLLRSDQSGTGGSESLNWSGVTPGATYYARVGSYSYGSTGSFTLNVDFEVATLPEFFFTAFVNGSERELLSSGGTAATTGLLKNFSGGVSSDPQDLTLAGDRLYFSATLGNGQRELFISDGTTAGTQLLKNLSGLTSSQPEDLLYNPVLDRLFFTALRSDGNRELFISDGTAAGTKLLKNLGGTVSSAPSGLTNVGGEVFFSARMGNGQRELHKSDGTTAGTGLVTNLYGATNSAPQKLIESGGTLYFTAVLPSGNRELHKSDGTTTELVRNLGQTVSGNPEWLTDVAGTLYFVASLADGQRELFKSDGTTAGTVMVKNLLGSTSSDPRQLTNVNGQLFFAAKISGGQRELYRSDGTGPGTQIVKNISGASSSNPTWLTNVNGTLFFSAVLGNGQRELFKSNGTSSGTVMVRNLSGLTSSIPTNLTAVGSKLYFSAVTGNGQRELHSSDGTSGGTGLFANFAGGNSATPLDITPADVAPTFGFTDQETSVATSSNTVAERFANPLDVNQDRIVSPIDALMVINTLNTAGNSAGEFGSSTADVNQDGMTSPLDALLIITYLNGGSPTPPTPIVGESDKPETVNIPAPEETEEVVPDPTGIALLDDVTNHQTVALRSLEHRVAAEDDQELLDILTSNLLKYRLQSQDFNDRDQ